MERTSRWGIGVASTITNTGFQAAKFGTNLGFGVAKGITSTFASGAGTIADYALTGRNNGTGLALGLAVSSAFGFAESVAIGSIMLGERIAVASIAAAQDSVDLLLGLFGNDEASFSLTAFGQLVRREWSSPVMAEHLPEKRYGLPAMMQALAAWAAIQSITQFYTETQWFQGIREVRPAELETMMSTNDLAPTGLHHEVHVTDDTLLPNHGGQIVSAEIGHMGQTNRKKPQSRVLVLPTLRRLSKMVLAGYGGAGMIFFGVPLIHMPDDATGSFSSPEAVRTGEESVVKDVIGSIDVEDSGKQVKDKATQSFSWWNLLLGKHDQEIFESYAFGSGNLGSKSNMSTTALLGSKIRMPRFWVVTDHDRKEVVLVLRGTMSLNELAVDLTCDPIPFKPGSSEERPKDGEEVGPEQLHRAAQDSQHYEVHGGMLKLARAMGSPDKAVHGAVKKALSENEGYDLILCGHSLGAGIAALFALMWADPVTCLTTMESNLPSGHRVFGYLFAPPCLVSKELSMACRNLLTSFVYSHDVVSRLSLGSVRDMARAAMWLCATKGEERPLNIVRRALEIQRKTQSKTGSREEEITWFLSLRKTLEANMKMADLFPPGRVLWALDDQDLQPAFRTSTESNERVRLFEVLRVDKVFNQITFSRRMLGSHMPLQHDRVINQLVSQQM